MFPYFELIGFMSTHNIDSKYYNKVHSTVVSNSQCAISYNIANISDQHICTLSTYVYYFPYLCPVINNRLLFLIQRKIINCI